MPYIYEKQASSSETEKLSTPRLIQLDGDVTGAALFDGSKDVTIITKLETTGSGGLTPEDIGFGLTIKNKKVVVDTPVLAGKDMGFDEDGRLITEAVDVNLLYVPGGTDLVIGDVDDE